MAFRSADDRRAALQRGAEAETFAVRELETQGWTVLARNWRGGGGELDVVVHRETAIRFVEVKARRPGEDPLEALTPSKLRKLRGAARAFLATQPPVYDDVAFLIASVSAHADGWAVEWLDDAFDG
ncbi:MAG: YraN family protein [Deltaproteobacteria bacterium]|nr:MAG: YraN family protein [Deltaproteobacteria bacterium]